MRRKRAISMVLILCMLSGNISAQAEEQNAIEETVLSTEGNRNEAIPLPMPEEENLDDEAERTGQEEQKWSEDGVFSEAEGLPEVDESKPNEAEEEIQTNDSDVWSYNGIITDLISPQEKYTVPIRISADVSGDIEELQYKFVWMKNNWDSWGVLHDFSDRSTIEWFPSETGQYFLYVDVQDREGKITTQSIPYEIIPVQWQLNDIYTAPEESQKKGSDVEITANVSGNTEGLQYKFVWMKNDWESWGIIQNFSESNQGIWHSPTEAGAYKLYVDVKDRDGKIVSKSIPYQLLTQVWSHGGVVINEGKPQQVNRTIPIRTILSGETQDLQYKYVWMKDNWADWGVIRDFDFSNQASWYPTEAGTYEIYSDVKDSDGYIKTRKQTYIVQQPPWKIDEIQVEGTGSYFVGDSTQVTIVPSGETEGLQYKVVQKYGDNWDDWKVVQYFSENRTITLNLAKAGTYTIYVDVMDQEGQIFKPVERTISVHEYQQAKAQPSKVTLGKATVVTPIVSGHPNGIEYKYVWAKDGWEEWGVLKEFSTATSVEWTPPSEGRYDIYIDARLNGKIQTRAVGLDVVRAKNGWYYERGYKLYYEDGKLKEDVRDIIGWQPDYEIKVNKQACCVTVYAKDGGNGYIIPVVSFACSPGSATPIGTFYTQNKYRWHHLYGADGQFCTRITGHVLFHSPPYSSFNNHTMWPKEYNKLGTWASAGCVRLRTGDAMWIYNNCSLGTKVTIYNSSSPGPFSKPVYDKIPLTQTWDPTDPYA